MVSNGTRLRLSAPMPLLRGATRTITEQLQQELANHFGTPLRLSPPRGGRRSCFCCAPGGARKRGCKRRCEGQGGIPALHPVARRAATRRPKAAAKTAMWYSDAFVTATRPPCADRPPPPGGGAENAALRAAANTTFMRKAFRFSGQFATVSQQKPPVFQAFSNFSFFSAFATNSQRIRNSRFRVRCFRCCSFRRMFLDNFRIIPPSKSGRIVDIYLTLA